MHKTTQGGKMAQVVVSLPKDVISELVTLVALLSKNFAPHKMLKKSRHEWQPIRFYFVFRCHLWRNFFNGRNFFVSLNSCLTTQQTSPIPISHPLEVERGLASPFHLEWFWADTNFHQNRCTFDFFLI